MGRSDYEHFCLQKRDLWQVQHKKVVRLTLVKYNMYLTGLNHSKQNALFTSALLWRAHYYLNKDLYVMDGPKTQSYLVNAMKLAALCRDVSRWEAEGRELRVIVPTSNSTNLE